MTTRTRPAAVWKRILAFLLDLYLGLAVASALITLMAPNAAISFTDAIADPSLLVSPLVTAAFLYLTLFVLLYHVACEYIVGQTPGMLVFGLTIKNHRAAKNEHATRESLTLGQAFIRNLFLIPFFPFYLFWLVEPLFYVFQGERLLEYWTKTETIE